MSKRFCKFTLSPILLSVALLASALLTSCAQKKHVANEDLNDIVAEGGGEYNYAQLQTRTLDDMNAVVRRQEQKAKKYFNDGDEDSAKEALQSAAQYVLSRPDHDNVVSKVIAPIRTELKNINSLEASMQKVVANAVKGLKNSSLKPSDRATYYFVLVNFMSEFKPDLKFNPNFRRHYEIIRDAKIKMDGRVTNDLKLRAMARQPTSPSDVAAKVLSSVKSTAPKYDAPQDDLESES